MQWQTCISFNLEKQAPAGNTILLRNSPETNKQARLVLQTWLKEVRQKGAAPLSGVMCSDLQSTSTLVPANFRGSCSSTHLLMVFTCTPFRGIVSPLFRDPLSSDAINTISHKDEKLQSLLHFSPSHKPSADEREENRRPEEIKRERKEGERRGGGFNRGKCGATYAPCHCASPSSQWWMNRSTSQ